jgi:hypothetical protein
VAAVVGMVVDWCSLSLEPACIAVAVYMLLCLVLNWDYFHCLFYMVSVVG